MLLVLSLDIGMPIPFSVSMYSIFKHFSQSSAFDDWVDHQSLPPRGGYVHRVIGLLECDSSLRPFQITGRRRSDRVHFSVDDFQATLTFNVSENHQSGIDVGVTIIVLLLILNLVCFLLLFLGLFLSELLD